MTKIGDDFIDLLLVWNEFAQMANTVTKQIVRKLMNWCIENGMDYASMMKMVRTRDDIIDYMLVNNLNPYYNGLMLPTNTYNLLKIIRQNAREGMDEIRKIKRCIYAGYRLNLAVWYEPNRTYVMHHRSQNVRINSDLVKYIRPANDETSIMPANILIGSLLIRKEQRGDLYVLEGSVISIMDGFVDVDYHLK